MSRGETAPGPRAAIWHDLECGAYRADLALWEELADRAGEVEPARILDLGCGAGRVSIHLAALGHPVTALDVDPDLLEVAVRRARGVEAGVAPVLADARSFELGESFDLVLAPMQLVQLFDSSAERLAVLEHARDHLRPGGGFAAALADLAGEAIDDEYLPPPPDMREVSGWVYASHAVGIRTVEDRRAIVLERIRRAVSPQGELDEEHDRIRLELLDPRTLERELQQVGLAVEPRRIIPATDEHMGSVVVIGRRP